MAAGQPSLGRDTTFSGAAGLRWVAWLLAALTSHALAARTCDVVAVCGARADNSSNAGPFLSACVAAGGPCSAPNSTLLFPAGAHFLSGSIDLSGTVNLTLSFSEAALFGSVTPPLPAACF